MTLTCAILDDYQDAARGSADWSVLDGRVALTVFTEAIAPQDRAATLAGFDIIVVMRERTPFDAALFGALPNLKLLVTSGMRNAAIDLSAAADRGVTVCGTGGLPNPTPELTWALLMAVARDIPAQQDRLRAGLWQNGLGFDLAGRKLGLIGLGKVGGAVAGYGRAFGMEVAGWSRNMTPERAAEHGATCAASLHELLSWADVVSLHIPLRAETRGLLGAAEFAAMKPGALFINTSRGPLVDTDALVAALDSGHLGGAGVDVFDEEPVPADAPILRAPKTVLTPHLGYVTQRNYGRYYGETVEDIAGWLDGAPVRVIAAPG